MGYQSFVPQASSKVIQLGKSPLVLAAVSAPSLSSCSLLAHTTSMCACPSRPILSHGLQVDLEPSHRDAATGLAEIWLPMMIHVMAAV